MSLVSIPHDDSSQYSLGPVDESKPMYYEKYGDEVRESYAETRQDRMHFRMVDPKGNESRLFNKGRSDDARECTTYLLDSRVRSVVFGGQREDGCIEYQRTVSKSGGSAVASASNYESSDSDMDCIMYGLKFEGRSDGVQRVVLSLRAGAELDHGSDTPATLFRDKVWHCAIVVDPSNKKYWNGIAESYYEMKDKNLRIVLENVVSGVQTIKNYSCLLPNNDEVYETARFAIMTAVQLFLGVERDLFFHLPMFVPGTSESNATAIQNKKLEETIHKMYKGLDDMSSTSVNAWGDNNKNGSPQRIAANSKTNPDM